MAFNASPPGDGPSMESIAVQSALETRPTGESISQIPEGLLELAQQLGLDPQNPEHYELLTKILQGAMNGFPQGMFGGQ